MSTKLYTVRDSAVKPLTPPYTSASGEWRVQVTQAIAAGVREQAGKGAGK